MRDRNDMIPNVGDSVYMNGILRTGCAEKHIIESVQKYGTDVWVRARLYGSSGGACSFPASEIGKTVFVSEQDAIKSLWDEFGDIPMHSETECIEAPWLEFPVGTHRETIWHWFEKRFNIRVADLMYDAE